MLLECKNLTYRYPGTTKTILNSISFTLDRPGLHAIFGPSGVGKSTLCDLLLGFLQPSSGKIAIFGKDSVVDSVEAKHRVGYLAGDIALYNSLTGQQVLEHLTALGKNTDWDYVEEGVFNIDQWLLGDHIFIADLTSSMVL